MAYLKNDEGVVPAHLVRPRSDDHIRNIALAIETLCICLQQSGIEVSSFKLSSLSDREVGLFHSYLLETKKFSKLLSLVTYDNGFQYYPDKVKDTRNVFRDYLVSGYKLGILTGRRREELISMRYDSIKEDENKNPVFIKVIDFKVSRIQNLQGNEKKVFVPVTKQLRDFLQIGRAHV